MKKTILRFTGLILFFWVLNGFEKPLDTDPYKCMIQMIDYKGQGAYIVVSLINPEGTYQETLFVHGNDLEWYLDLRQWWDNFYGKKRNNIDAITGETIAGGERMISVLKIPTDKIDTGYSIRFETAVEDKKYYPEDLQFELTSEALSNGTIEGAGYIRYIRLIAQ